jgi:hypothetical protein
MPAAPVRPGQEVTSGLLHGQDQPPQQPAHLGHPQWEARPRLALNTARECLFCGGSRRFLNASTAMLPARKTVNSAKAHMARVICRYHPVPLRTS